MGRALPGQRGYEALGVERIGQLQPVHHRSTFAPQQVSIGGLKVDLSVDSLELAWLIHQIEQRHGKPFDVEDEVLARMTTVGGVCGVLAELGFGAAA